MLALETSEPAVLLYHRVPRTQQRLILLHDLPVDAKRVELASRSRRTARGVVYDGAVTWEIHRLRTETHPGTGALEQVIVETKFSKFLGALPVDWLADAAPETAPLSAPAALAG